MTITNTEKLTHDVLAVCGMISEDAAREWDSFTESKEHDERMQEFTRVLHKAAGIARLCDEEVAFTLYSWLSYHMAVGAGGIYGRLAARAAFGYTHREGAQV